MHIKFGIALLYGKLINSVIRIVDKSRGSSNSGRAALRICPDMIKHFKGIDPSKVLFITGTNGKSTTNNLINHILKAKGYKVVSNIEGANLLTGICTALIRASDLGGNVDADFYIFETDERYLHKIRENLACDNLLVTNIQKDQVQRNGDPDYIYRKIESVVKDYGIRLFLNNDEPRSNSLGRYAGETVRYGVSAHSQAFKKDESYPGMACPVCRHKLEFKYFNTDGIGSYKCSNCGYSNEKTADYVIKDVDFENNSCSINDVKISMPYTPPFMLYNYAAATAAACSLADIDEAFCGEMFRSFKNIAGRFEILHYKNKTIKYTRIKQENPETLQSCINVIADDSSRKMVALGLAPVADYTPYYMCSFYAYDCDFSKLISSDVERYFCFTNAICYDAANRLIYEGVSREDITIADTDEIDALLEEIDKAETDNIYLITKLELFEKLRKHIEGRGADHE